MTYNELGNILTKVANKHFNGTTGKIKTNTINIALTDREVSKILQTLSYGMYELDTKDSYEKKENKFIKGIIDKIARQR